MIRPGETFVWGLDSVTAAALLNAAASVGADPGVVRTTMTGFIVPDAVYDAAVSLHAEQPAPPAPPKKRRAPRKPTGGTK